MENKPTHFIMFTLGMAIFVGLPFWGIYYLFVGVDYGFLKSEITAYTATCNSYAPTASSTSCANSDRYALTPVTFKIYADQQHVVAYKEGQVARLSGCAIRDLKNWSCNAGDDADQVGFRDGSFFDTSNPGLIPLSKFDWYNLHKNQ